MNVEAADAHMPVNLGNPGEFTMNELADEVGKATGRDIRVIRMPLPEDDPRQRKPNIERAKKLLGWEPTIPLAQGLKKTVEYFSRTIGGVAAGAIR
jgi:UDP-glucuronate decarboxylase